MGNFIDLTGRVYGSLTVIKQAEGQISPSGRHHKMWLCKCECGNFKVINGENLKRGLAQSCGCYQKKQASAACITHGDTDSRLYAVWCAIKRRCDNPNVPEYPRYGGRGITMCKEWHDNYASFKEWAYLNGYDENAPRGKCTIDRIDNDGNYEPDNCRWVDHRTQMNNVSYNHFETYNGETHTVAEWAELYHMPYSKLLQRLNTFGYGIEKALTYKNSYSPN